MEVLAFTAEHRLVLETQVTSLVGARAARAVLRSLVTAGHLTREALFTGQPPYCQIRRGGLVAIGSDLPVPRRPRYDAYKHDIGLAWLWLAARRGTFGEVAEVLGERRLRSHDGAVDRPDEPLGIRVGGVDARGNDRLHYPDLLLIDRRGRELALELELTRKPPPRLERILDAYGAEPRISAVLYLAEDHRTGRAIARAVSSSARAAGLRDLVHVQLVEPILGRAGEPAGSVARAAERGPRAVERGPRPAERRPRGAERAGLSR